MYGLSTEDHTGKKLRICIFPCLRIFKRFKSFEYNLLKQISFHFRKDIQQNIQDRYGNRYDPRFHSIPGEYDPENDPRFSDPRYQDPRNLPKYQNNRHRVPQDRYDSKYRYYERYILFLHLMLRS